MCASMLNSVGLCGQEKESWDLEIPEKLETAARRKEEGNALFKLGKYARAAKKYEKVRWIPKFSIIK